MEIGRAFRQLASVVDAVEDTECDVTDAEASNELVADGSLAVHLTVAMPLGGDELPESASMTVNGAEIEDGKVLTADLTVETPTETSSISGSKSSAPVDEDRPYYEDRERLQQVYDEHETFAEMTDALGVDVTPATVRQHMVKHGIHGTSDTDGVHETSDTAVADAGDAAGEADHDSCLDSARRCADPGESDGRSDDHGAAEGARRDDSAGAERAEEAITDGLGLPDDISMGELEEIVQSSRTFHEAHQRMGLDREEARHLLAELDLLDLVMGRLATADHRSVSPDLIDERIRGATSGHD